MLKTTKIEIAKRIETATTKCFGLVAFVGLAALGILAFGEMLINVGLALD